MELSDKWQPGWFADINARTATNNIWDVDFTETGAEPVTLAQAKAHLRVDFTDDDAYITALLTVGRMSIEGYTYLSLIQKNLIVTCDMLKDLELPYGPILSDNDSIILTDADGDTVDPTTYQITGVSFKTISSLTQKYFRATLQYSAGYTAVPMLLQQAILNEIAFRYENRGDSADTRKSVNPGICEAAQVLAEPYQRLTWR